jgi:citronellol/citronellal dehydrogenase
MQKKLHDFTAGVPLQRFGTEAEISAAIIFLLSPAAAYVTGSCVRVDGGTPNARTTWKLEPHNHSTPFEGFHRSRLPEALKKAR